MNQPLRLIIGILFASFCGAIWISLTFISDLFSGGKLTVGALVFGALVHFAMILVVFVILGLPAYFLAKYFRLSVLVTGLLYGFILGLIASAGYGVTITENLMFGTVTFGLAGIISSGTFLYVMRSNWAPES